MKKTGEKLEQHSRKALKLLAKTDGMLGANFYKSENPISDPAKLSRIIKMIEEENWISLDADAKGDLYTGLLQKKGHLTHFSCCYHSPVDAAVHLPESKLWLR